MAPSVGAAGTVLAAAGTGLEVLGQLAAGHTADMNATVNAGTIAQMSELNAQLIEQGANLNAGVNDFNAAALEAQAKTAIEQGQQQELMFRQKVKGIIGSQRASYAAQGVDVGSGSAADVQADTAKQAELDAITIRTNAALTAWGFKTQAQGQLLQAANTLRLGQLQATNTREVGQVQALNARVTGGAQSAAANWGVASTIVGSAASFIKNRPSAAPTLQPGSASPYFSYS